MTKEQKIKTALLHCNLSVSKLAEKLNTSAQNLSMKLKRDSLNDEEMQSIAENLGCTWVSEFRFSDGTVIDLSKNRPMRNLLFTKEFPLIPQSSFALFCELYYESDAEGITPNITALLKVTKHTEEELQALIGRGMIQMLDGDKTQILETNFSKLEEP